MRGMLTFVGELGIGNHNVVTVVIVNLDILVVVVLRKKTIELAVSINRIINRIIIVNTYIMNNADMNISSLLRRVEQRLIRQEGFAEAIYVSSLGLASDLLTGPLPLERLCIVVLAVGRQ